MVQVSLNKRIIGLVLRQKTVRVALLLSGILLVVCIGLFSFSYSFNKKIAENDTQILDIQNQLKNLQMVASQPDPEITEEAIKDRVLAPYDQIVPFISFLESLFAIIDKDSKITIKNEEDEIMINRYADYEVRLQPRDKMDILLKALDGLYESRYLTKITNFDVKYVPTEDEIGMEIGEISMVVRLYFE